MYTQPVQHNKYNKDMLWLHAIVSVNDNDNMFVSIFTMLRCPDCARVTWHREQLQGRALTRRWGQLWGHVECGRGHWLMNPVTRILAVSSSIKCPESVHITMLQCKHCEQLHFHTSEAVLQFLHNPSKTGDKDIDLQSWLRNYIITTVKWWCRYLLTY